MGGHSKMLLLIRFQVVFSPTSAGPISLPGRNTETQNGSRMDPTHRSLLRQNHSESTSQYMHYIKLGFLHPLKVCFWISSWQFEKTTDNTVSNNRTSENLRNYIFGYIDKHQQIDVHRLITASDFSRLGHREGGHSRKKNETSTTTKC